MTSRTLSYLKSTLFATGQAAGAITPTRMQDLVDTMSMREGGSLGGGTFVRVTDPEFGADPTGVADSTAAFQNAMAAGPCLVPSLTPAGAKAVYKVSNCIVPTGASLIGWAAMGHGEYNTDVRPQIIPTTAGATRLFNVDGKNGILMQGMYLNCIPAASTCDAISAGSVGMTVRDLMVECARFGIGGQVSGSTAVFPAASWILNIFNCNFQGCIAGLGDIVDGFIFGGSVTACQDGWNATAVSGAVSVNGLRIEQNGRNNAPAFPYLGAQGYGVRIANGCADVTFSGCLFDANGLGGAFVQGNHITFTGCDFRRNGGNTTSGTTLASTSAHLTFDTASHIVVSGCTTTADFDDFVYCPAFAVRFVGTATNNSRLVITGNDLSGYQGSTAGATKLSPQSSSTTWKTGTTPTGTGVNAILVKNNLGTGTAAQDIDTR